MSKNKSQKTSVDFDMGFDMIVPATQEAFKKSFSGSVRKVEKNSIAIFKQKLHSKVEEDLKITKHFPSEKEIFIFIVQYFISEKEYRSRDIDNMSKTVLDALCGRFYTDDGQVKILLVTKKMEKRVPQNFAYIAIKELKDGKDIDALKTSGVERSVTMYQELKSKGII